MTAKKITCAMLAAVISALLCTGAFAAQTLSYPPYPQVEFEYSDTVTPGTIRYASQNPNSEYFYSQYWNGDPGLASHECLAACLSMALSYVGVEATPGYLLAQNGGVARPNYPWGGSTYSNPSFDTAWNNYYGGDGKYSPPIIHLNSYSSGGHYVLVIAKISDTLYQVADPYNSDLWTITISAGTASYNYWGVQKTDSFSGAIQYYYNNGGITPQPEPSEPAAVLKFVIGSDTYTVGGVTKQMDIVPYIKNSRTYLPARFVSEELGASVIWNSDARNVTITKDTVTIVLNIDSTAASVNGEKVTLATAPEITDGRTCLPIRFVAQTLGAAVDWQVSTKTVTITM